MYWLMVASEDLLLVASAQADYGRLRNYYLDHRHEERNHQIWLKHDLENLGVNLVHDFRAAAIAGSQYYLIYHYHPALLLGYMHVLEAWPKPLDVIEKLEESYGPLRCLRYHAEHDPKHTEDLKAEIAALPVELQAPVETNSQWVRTWLGIVLNTMDKETLCQAVSL